MIVTVSAEYGCGSLAIAQRAAERLGYTLVDRQLPVVVAKRLRLPRDVVERTEDSSRSLGERILSGLGLSTPEVAPLPVEDFDDEVIRGIRRAVDEYAARGNAVIVGRGAGVILGRRSDVLRLFLRAPRERRIALVVERMAVDAKEAARELDRVDRARHEYLREWFSTAFGDPRDHDLAIDTDRFGIEGSAAIVVAAVAARS